MDISLRPRRNRRSETIRELLRENELNARDFVAPLFIADHIKPKTPIKSLPDIYYCRLAELAAECKELYALGIRAVAPFPVLDQRAKNPKATESANEKGLYCRGIRIIKENFPDMIVIADCAMDPYSSDGHDGLLDAHGHILNDETLPILGKMAVACARAGADYIAPSDMMDGRVGYIRSCLDRAGLKDTGILSYAVKYASNFYGPFRDALDSMPQGGDKKTYQMDYSNSREALHEIELDIAEGADIVMVKPGLAYLDIVALAKEISTVPVAVYNVSGEYAMLKAAGEKGWLDYKKVVFETLTAFKRAGADMIFSYHAKEAAGWLKNS